MRNKPVIGFIGLGLMGHGMAKNILEGGYELWVQQRPPLCEWLQGSIHSLVSSAPCV